MEMDGSTTLATTQIFVLDPASGFTPEDTGDFDGDKDSSLALDKIIGLLDQREDLRSLVKGIEDANYIKPYH